MSALTAGLLTRRAAARRLHVGTGTVDLWRRSGLLVPVTTPGGRWRYRADDVDRARYRQDCRGWCPDCRYRFTARGHEITCEGKQFPSASGAHSGDAA